MGTEQTTWHGTDRLSELSAEFTGWRIGRGGSGYWWAVRGNDLVRTTDLEELRVRLHELTTAQPHQTRRRRGPDARC